MVGKDKGKEGKITHIFKNTNKVIIEGINMVKKHRKPNNSNETGGIIETETPLNASNVMFLDSNNKPSRKIDRTAKKEKKTAPKKENKEPKKEEKKETKKETKKTATKKAAPKKEAK